eukprot:750317-Hanusia_phi.AAC.1
MVRYHGFPFFWIGCWFDSAAAMALGPGDGRSWRDAAVRPRRRMQRAPRSSAGRQPAKLS